MAGAELTKAGRAGRKFPGNLPPVVGVFLHTGTRRLTNLRGIIVPIVDMRIKFNLGAPRYDQFTVVIILSIAGRVVGMVVDSVSDVTTLQPEQIRPAPEMGTALNTDYLVGLGMLEERMLILLDIERLMSSDDMGLLPQA